MKVLLLAVSSLLYAATSVRADSCSARNRFTPSYDMEVDRNGSLTEAFYINHYHTNNKNARNDVCDWTISCPEGSFVGFTSLRFHIVDGCTLQINETVPLPGVNKTLDYWNETAESSYDGVKGIYPTANKVSIRYTSGPDAGGSGFYAWFKCYETKCPADLVPHPIYNTAAEAGFTWSNTPISGTACEFNFSCPVDLS